MRNDAVEQLAQNIIAFYDEYDLRISGKINDQTAFQLIETIEQKFKTDKIRLSDGTRLWNLIRIFLYSNFQRFDKQTIKKKVNAQTIKSIVSLFKESFQPLYLPKDITVCGFSSSESRRLYNDTYYDIYLDPLYEIFGEKLAVFEWPETSGYRRKYDHPVYSRHHVQMHIPIWSKTFWNLLFNRVIGSRQYTLESEDVLFEIINYFSTTAAVEKTQLLKNLSDFISVFAVIKQYLYHILEKMHPRAVLIRCGYGRFPMALAQACRELDIPSIELQHGLITKYLPAYRRVTPSANKDCVPEYLLAHGDIYAEMVRNGNLFDVDKVVTTGYPYLQKTLRQRKKPSASRQSLSQHSKTVLFTSQWIVASEIKNFILDVADRLEQEQRDLGILFKPHPYDKNDYSDLQESSNIVLIDKYEDIFKLFTITDIHSTVYSTSGLEAMAFGIPNIFVDINKMTQSVTFPYIVHSPSQFVDSVNAIFTHYKDTVAETKAVANLFFTSSPEERFKNFFTDLQIL